MPKISKPSNGKGRKRKQQLQQLKIPFPAEKPPLDEERRFQSGP